MPRKSKTLNSSGRTILLVDDNPEYLNATRILLEREGHQVLCAMDGSEALRLLHQQPGVDLLLLDYYMPGMTGEETVTCLRQFNPYVQVILQTGYASEQPPRELLKRLDIQGYYDKSEGPEKLLLWVDVGLKAAYAFQLIYKSRQGLRFILDATPDLHKIKPLEELLQGILLQVSGLLGVVNCFLAVLPLEHLSHQANASPTDGFLAIMEDDADLTIRASTGRFLGSSKANSCLDSEKLLAIRSALMTGKIQQLSDVVIMPLCVGQMSLGVIYLDRSIHQQQDMELMRIFANQAAVAIQNAQLHEMATIDPLTGAFIRRFFEQCLLRELRTAIRARQPLCLLMLDADDMKSINDTAGHLIGDRALTAIGSVLRDSVRATDIVGRYGGDEFIVALPQTTLEGAEILGKRIFEGLKLKTVRGPKHTIPLLCSIGVSELNISASSNMNLPVPMPASFFQTAAKELIKSADKSLYEAKHNGRNQMNRGTLLDWSTIPVESMETGNRTESEPDNPLGWK
jgi:two-component system, cell cycle response regulator